MYNQNKYYDHRGGNYEKRGGYEDYDKKDNYERRPYNRQDDNF